nr:MAG TPA: hypothetical protein [Caudoviricetes sp.]
MHRRTTLKFLRRGLKVQFRSFKLWSMSLERRTNYA